MHGVVLRKRERERERAAENKGKDGAKKFAWQANALAAAQGFASGDAAILVHQRMWHQA